MHGLIADFFFFLLGNILSVRRNSRTDFFLTKTTACNNICILPYIGKKVGWVDLDSFVSVLGLENRQRKNLGLSHIKPPLGEEILRFCLPFRHFLRGYSVIRFSYHLWSVKRPEPPAKFFTLSHPTGLQPETQS